jgi:hypothetical protein
MKYWFAVALLVTASVHVHAQVKQIYLCHNTPGGQSTYQDFPCAPGKGGTTGITSSTSPRQNPNPANVPPADLANPEQFVAARGACMKLMSQYDFTTPLMRCALDDHKCFSRANQESIEISRRLTSLPQWKAQQCDLVMQIESAATKNESGCSTVQIVRPVPFLGTAHEEIYLSDGSVWKDLSYKYLYLYAYNPMVRICPAQGKMILDAGGTKHTFSLMRLR